MFIALLQHSTDGSDALIECRYCRRLPEWRFLWGVWVYCCLDRCGCRGSLVPQMANGPRMFEWFWAGRSVARIF